MRKGDIHELYINTRREFDRLERAINDKYDTADPARLEAISALLRARNNFSEMCYAAEGNLKLKIKTFIKDTLSITFALFFVAIMILFSPY